jgi:hypothetical protein
VTTEHRVRRADIVAALAHLGDPERALAALMVDARHTIDRGKARLAHDVDVADVAELRRRGGLKSRFDTALTSIAALDEVFGAIARWIALERATRAIEELEEALALDGDQVDSAIDHLWRADEDGVSP